MNSDQGSKSDFYDILSITGNIFNYILTCNESINYKSFRKWCLVNKIYYNSFKEKALEEFEGKTDNQRERSREQYDLEKTYNMLLDKINVSENVEQKNHFLIILQYLKKHIFYKSALYKLC
jgi:hypothetical protein